MELRSLLLVLVLLAPLLPGTTGEQHAPTTEHLPVAAAVGNTTTAASCDPLRIVHAAGAGGGGGASPSATAAATGDDAYPPPPQLSRPNRDLPTVPTPLDHEPVPTPPSPDFIPASAVRTIDPTVVVVSAMLLLLIAATH
uniref:Uncharacterized protein n=1 Tax=Oryza punctata TaxID=4537 RepID=A0A0E0MDV0_ORYPU